MTDVCPL
jgi:hypothetical protein